MSFPDPSPFMMSPQPFGIGDDAVGYWSQFSVTNDQYDSPSQYDSPNPPAKRPRNSEDSRSNSGSLQSANHRSNPPVNRGTTNIFFKTRMCAKFRMGTCRNGENCNFAHGMEDMRQPPPNWQEIVGGREREDDHRSLENWDDDQKIIHKMKLCKKFYNGEECPYGNRCNFLHEDPAKFRDDSGKFRESTAICIGTTPIGPGNGSNQSDGSRAMNGCVDARANVKPVYWKTKLCTKFETTGQCPFGDKCHFAHGLGELQGPIGRAEGEATGALSVSVKPLPLAVNDAFPAQTVNTPTLAEDGQGKKCFLKWKGTKKINQIYADWLDDLPLVQNLPNKVEG